MAEAGIPGYDFSAWYMLIAPARTPPAIIERVNADLRKISTLPDFRKRIEDIGGEVLAMSVKESNDYLNNEFTRWAKVVKDRNIKAD